MLLYRRPSPSRSVSAAASAAMAASERALDMYAYASLRRERDALTLPSSPTGAMAAYTVCADADLKLFAHCYGNSVTALLECIFISAF